MKQEFFRFYKALKKFRTEKKFTYVEVKQFWEANGYLSSFSGAPRRHRKSREKTESYKHNNLIGTQFQIDTYYPQTIYDIKWIILAIDLVTRKLYYYIIRENLKAPNIKKAFKYLIKDIKKTQLTFFRKMKPQSHITFGSDPGSEFINKTVDFYLKSRNASIFPLSHVFMIDRAIVTLSQLIAAVASTKNNFSLQRNIKQIILLYNSRVHSSLGTSPIEAERHFKPPEGKYDYIQNKQNIEKDLKIVKRKFPILTPVKRISFKKDRLSGKWSTTPKYSEEIFYVETYRRPRNENERIGVRIIDSDGIRIEGPEDISRLKKVSTAGGKLTISSISKRIVNEDKIIVYYVCIKRFGKRIFEIYKSSLKNYIITIKAMQQLKELNST